MTMHEKIVTLYPELKDLPVNDTTFNKLIIVKNDSDGQGDYIAKWEHPTLQRPTDEQLAQITE
jgi:hypothetical protein